MIGSRALDISLIALLFVGGFTLNPAAAQTLDTLPQVRVTGTATTELAPDFAEWEIEISVRDGDPLAARQAVEERRQELVANLEPLGNLAADLAIGPISVREYKEWDGDQRQNVFKGYEISREIVVRQREISAADRYLEAIAIQNVTFSMTWRSTREIAVRHQTRLDAVSVAQDKAKALVEQLGVKLGRPLLIDAVDEDPYRAMMSASNKRSRDPDSPQPEDAGQAYQPGNILVTVRVEVAFAID